jgi:hypothetical protein
MKKSLFICGIMALKLASTVSAQTTAVASDWTLNTTIPVGNPVGISTYQTFGNLPSSPITDVAVDLNISGGYNGGVYGYLVLQDATEHTATETLLNNVGTTASNPFGSPGSGFNITLSDSGTINGSIHGATGIPTGMWLPDSPNTLDETFGGMTANGTWTLFLADTLAGGGTPTLQSWGLDVTVVPEPATGGLLLVGAFLAVAGKAWMRRGRNNS